jgi:hypothetical protein
LGPGEVGAVHVLVASESQASTVFRHWLGLIERSLFLRQQIESVESAQWATLLALLLAPAQSRNQ